MRYRDPEKRRKAAREATRRWYQRNKEVLGPARRQRDRERYAVNRESVLLARRERYAKDAPFAATVRARNHVWYERNREKRREYQLRYRQDHGDAVRARERENSRRSYAKIPVQPSTITGSGVFEIFSAPAPTCEFPTTSAGQPLPESTSRSKSGRRYSQSTKDAAHTAVLRSALRRITGRRCVAGAPT